MTPDQLQRLAEKFRQSQPLPNVGQPLGAYTVSRVAHDMADFLDRIALEDNDELR